MMLRYDGQHPLGVQPPQNYGSQTYRALEPQDVRLEIRQQPREALVTVDGKEKSRKPVDPPPIVQIHIEHGADPASHYLQNPYLFMCCHLVSDKDDVLIPTQDGKAPLIGSLSSSLHRLKDINNSDGGFFVFGDVSAKVPGCHRLQFSLFDLHKETHEVLFLKTIFSDPFKVVLQKDFRGLEESTYLSRAFSDQGVRLRLRKEPRTFAGGKKRSFDYTQQQQQLPNDDAATKRIRYNEAENHSLVPSRLVENGDRNSWLQYDQDPNSYYPPPNHYTPNPGGYWAAAPPPFTS